MGIKESLHRGHTKIKTAMHLHRARRRTRQVFRRKPNMSVIVATMLIVIMGLVVYFFAIYPSSRGNLGIADERTLVDEDAYSSNLVEENAQMLMGIEQEAASEEETAPSRSWPIDITLPENITLTNIYGDTSQDVLFPGDCSLPIKDAKRDVNREFRYNVEAQEEFAKIEAQYVRGQEKIREAYADLVVKRRKLDAIRVSCIEDKEPFGESFNEFLDVSINKLKE